MVRVDGAQTQYITITFLVAGVTGNTFDIQQPSVTPNAVVYLMSTVMYSR
jgi:hypothetical protein